MKCRWIESSLQHFEKQAPRILQEDIFEGFKVNTNSFPIEELDLELIFTIPKMELLIV